MKHAHGAAVLGSLVIFAAFLFAALPLRNVGFSANAAAVEQAGPTPEPVDDDMHHFMEYVFEPSYKRLRGEMAKETKDRATWKAVKGDALTLAECANLLMMRAPETDSAQWQEFSAAVRNHGSQLYQAARKSDGDAAAQAYRTMITKCNACHDQFAGGEHQLKP